MTHFRQQTEQLLADAVGFDMWENDKTFDFIVSGQERAIAAVRAARASIITAAEAMATRLRAGGKLYYAGAGSSIRIGALDGSELHSTFGWPEENLGFLIAGGLSALTLTKDDAEDDASAGAEAASVCAEKDVLIAIAASGRTPYTIGAAGQAKANGCLVIALANNRGSHLLETCDIPILLESGAEAISGSTRLAAGTAQKATLNLLSTLTFTMLGCVHNGQMVNVIASNSKLRQRANQIVATIAGCKECEAAAALELANGSIKVAVLKCSGAPSLASAHQLLRDNGGNLRLALSRIHLTV